MGRLIHYDDKIGYLMSVSNKIHLLINCVKKCIDKWYMLLLVVYCELLWTIANSWVKHSTT